MDILKVKGKVKEILPGITEVQMEALIKLISEVTLESKADSPNPWDDMVSSQDFYLKTPKNDNPSSRNNRK